MNKPWDKKKASGKNKSYKQLLAENNIRLETKKVNFTQDIKPYENYIN